jgi:hypothetical protein
MLNIDKLKSLLYSKRMGKPEKPAGPGANAIEIGDIVPVSTCQMIDVFYLVKVGNEKLLVNREGVVFLKSLESGPDPTAGEQENKVMNSLLSNGHYGANGQEEVVELTCQPGSEDYAKAEKIVGAFLDFFLDHMRNEFRIICIKFSQMVKDSGQPLLRYLARERGGLAGLKAHLIRDFFTHTTIDERGLNILSFLTRVIALNEDGTMSPSQLTQEEKKTILIDFLNYVRSLGADSEKKKIFEKTYRDFIDQEYELLHKEGGAGFYISSSFIKAMKAQKDFLLKESNKNYLETAFRNAQRAQPEFVQTHMLSYLKALVILRLHSNSRKEQRGRNDDEREKFLYDIINYQKESN